MAAALARAARRPKHGSIYFSSGRNLHKRSTASRIAVFGRASGTIGDDRSNGELEWGWSDTNFGSCCGDALVWTGGCRRCGKENKRERDVRIESGALFRGCGGGTAFRPRRYPIEHDATAAQPANPDSRTDTGCKTASARQSSGQADAGRPKLPDRGAADL